MTFSKPYPITLLSFLLIGATALVFAFVFPVYQGPDEQIHYATIQYHAEPQIKTWPIIESHLYEDGQGIDKYHLSEEVIALGVATQFDDLKWQEANTQTFSLGTDGSAEQALRTTPYQRYIDTYPVHASPNTSYYYWITSSLEKLLSHLDPIERFFGMRLFSLLLYLSTVFVTYQITKKVFDSHLHQILFTLFFAFQPMLMATGVIVNIDIALIFGASLFFLGALDLSNAPTPKSHLTLVAGLLLAFLGKASGIAFVPVYILLYLFFFQQKYQLSYQKIIRFGFYALAPLLLFIFFVIPDTLLTAFLNPDATSMFSSPLQSILSYLDKTIGLDALLRTHTSYWGNFGWLDTKIHAPVLWLLFIVEIVAWVGTILYLFSKKTSSYLPSRKIIILALGMIFFLQLAIRFYDWRVFDGVGKIVIGAPGRYFLPTLAPHLLILLTGLGFFLAKNRAQFALLLKTLTVGMIMLCIYSLFGVIIPRYYF